MSQRIVMFALCGTFSLTAACGKGEGPTGTTAGGTSVGGTSGPGTTGSESNTGSGGTGSNQCPTPSEPKFSGAGAGGEGGAEHATPTMCLPFVCFTANVEVQGVPFVPLADAYLGATPDGDPIASNESGVPNVEVSNPEPGTVCMKGDDGAGLQLRLIDRPWEEGQDPWKTSVEPLRAASLGISAVTFTLEMHVNDGISIEMLSFPPPCGPAVFSSAYQDGNPLMIRESGKTTLSFATDFSPAFDPNEIVLLNFLAGDGEYDYCISDLKFLDEAGDEVMP